MDEVPSAPIGPVSPTEEVGGPRRGGEPGRRPVILDLGCGNLRHPGSIGVDILPHAEGVDVVADITRGLPFADNSVDGVYMVHVLEHISDLVGFMEELWRVCRPNGWVSIRGPHASSSFTTWSDPTHVRGLTLETFRYLEEGHPYGYYTKVRFKVAKGRLDLLARSTGHTRRLPLRLLAGLADRLANYSQRAQTRCERWWGPLVGIEEFHVVLRAVK